MRALAGPAVALTIAIGLLVVRAHSKNDAPPREFTELEASLAGEDGSCYSLSTILIANRLFGSTLRTWKKVGDDAWEITLEAVVAGRGGPTRQYWSGTFEKRGSTAVLVKVESSPGNSPDPVSSLDGLLVEPNGMHSTPVARCTGAGATGYHFTRK
jgi:hypothetical protein